MAACGVRRPNVLLVIVDDLRPELGCYGVDEIKTPSFDALGAKGVVFTQAYCQAGACAPSRASAMTGWRPDTTRVWSLGQEFRKTVPHVVTMPQHFHGHGYHTVSIGKIFHNHMPDCVSFDEPDLRPAEYNTPQLIDRDPESFYYDDELKEEVIRRREERIRRSPKAALGYGKGWGYGRSHEVADAPDEAFYDCAQTDLALEKLAELKGLEQPFFLALGYYRPHLPFVAPKRYWDLYDRDTLPLAPNPFLPKDSPHMAMNTMYELRACSDMTHTKPPSEGPLDERDARVLKHGYYASVSFVDACLGRLLDGLDELGLAGDTVVVLWGDHGWKLGEHGSWCKQTNYNIDTRVPLIVYDPRIESPLQKCNALVECVDLYATLCDLAGIEIPDHMEGISFKPLLTEPELNWKTAAFSQYITRRGDQRYMGRSMITRTHHYVEWYRWDPAAQTTTGAIEATELYDLEADVDENTNVADQPGNAEIVQRLSTQLRNGWQAATPPH